MTFMQNFAYFIVDTVFPVFLSEDFGFTDTEAGEIYGFIGLCGFLQSLLFTGYVIDKLGFMTAFNLGTLLLAIGRCVQVIAADRTVLVVATYSLVSTGFALNTPATLIAIRRFAPRPARGIAFSAYYLLMNLSGILSTPCVDIIRRSVRQPVSAHIGALSSVQLSCYKVIILVSLLTSLLSFMLACMVRSSD